MSKGIFDSAEIDLDCPICGTTQRKTIGWLKSHSIMSCPGCGRTIDLVDQGFKKELAEAEKSIKGFSKKIEALNKTARRNKK